MIKKLDYDDIKFQFNINNIDIKEVNYKCLIECNEIYERILPFISCRNNYHFCISGKFNPSSTKMLAQYLLQNACKRQIEDIIIYNEGDTRKPYFTPQGHGRKLKAAMEKVKNIYAESLLNFDNDMDRYNEDDDVLRIRRKKEEIINVISNMAKEYGFEMEYKDNSFNFIPLIKGEKITAEEYDNLSYSDRNEIIDNLSYMKAMSKASLAGISDLSQEYRSILKNKYFHYLSENVNKELYEIKEGMCESCWHMINQVSHNIKNFLMEETEKSILSYEEIIVEILNMYCSEVVVEHHDEKVPVVYECEPSFENIFGSIKPKFRNKDKNNYNYDYETAAGSILKANGGFLIIPLRELMKYPSTYNYLKRVLKYKRMSLSKEEGIFNIFQNPKPKCEDIPIDVNVILLGEEKYFYMMYQGDEEFGEIFEIMLESNHVMDIEGYLKDDMVKSIIAIGRENECLPLTEDGFTEIIRIMSRENGNRNKIDFHRDKIKSLLCSSSLIARYKKKDRIEAEDICCEYQRKTQIEKEILDSFKENIVLLNMSGSKIGQVNGMSVVDTGYTRIGRPIRITCTCSKGRGNIVDVQRETSLSGKIHNKSLGILRGFLNTLIGNYNGIPVDFNVSFEQIYGMVEGDSASVAEALVIVSSFLRVPLKQSIAVTGSINQLGEIQMVGGINEKIEGFYNTCKIKGYKNCGVLIPRGNEKNVIVNKEIEESVKRGEFSVYTMESFQDAMELMMEREDTMTRGMNFVDEIQREIKKYEKKDKNKN